MLQEILMNNLQNIFQLFSIFFKFFVSDTKHKIRLWSKITMIVG